MSPEELDDLHTILGHLARQLWDLQAERIGASNRVGAMERDGVAQTHLDRAQLIVDGLKDIERLIESDIRRAIKQHPLAPWIAAQRGIGLPTFAALLGVTGDIGRFPTVSKLWKYLGLHVTLEGTAPKKVKGQGWTHTDCQHLHLATCPKTCATDHHPNCAPGVLGTAYSPRGRTVACFNIGEMGIGHQSKGSGPYRAAYDAKKAYYEAERPDWPQIRRHKAALRYAAKEFIKALWVEWMRVLKPARLVEWEDRERERAAEVYVMPTALVPPTPNLDIDQEQAAEVPLMPIPAVPVTFSDFDRLKSCGGKRQHSDEASAQAAIVRMRCDGILDDLSTYHCRYCDRWHVGHTPGQRRSQKAG